MNARKVTFCMQHCQTTVTRITVFVLPSSSCRRGPRLPRIRLCKIRAERLLRLQKRKPSPTVLRLPPLSVSMKTSIVTQGLNSKSRSLYISSNLNTTSLRRLGNTKTRIYESRLSSISLSTPSHYTTSAARKPILRASYASRLCLSFPRLGARPISHLGVPRCPSNKQLCVSKRPQLSTQSLYKQPIHTPEPLRSSVGSWTAFFIACAVAILYSVSPGAVKHQNTTVEILEDIEQEISNMTGEALPGRPGTLTPDQEEKLREFWIATLQVFGVLDPKELNGNELAEIGNGRTKADTASTKKPEKEKKKKRMSLFRKNKDDDTDSVTSTDSAPHPIVADSDDKYGQTKEFHEALASLTPETLRATFWSMVKHDHPDALLLRFLRARKWDVEKALVMMVSTMRWRSADVHVDDDIMKNGELSSLDAANGSDPAKRRLGEDFLAQMRLGKSFLHGVDKNGRPMCFVRVKLHKQGEQSEESLERYTVFVIESARMVLQPPVDTACVVFDMTGFSMANMDYAPVKFMIKCFEANYPESLGVVLVHKAPWIFQGIWKIIKGWLDPVVASKVHFTNNVEEMEAYVPKPQIIHELGGAEDWTYQYVEPVPGENDTMKDTETRDKLLLAREEIVKEYEKATLEWIQGTGDQNAVKKSRNEIASKLKVDYWGLDPYVRARSYYDRVGMINPGGKIQFYPVKDEKVTVPETVPADAAGIAPPTTNGTKVETSEADLD
ncbi:hypothetical protein V8E51_012412 [Hyaloscypha variabilis]